MVAVPRASRASVDHVTAAVLPLVSQTAWEALHLRARIHPGQTVLIHAGAGGVGHIAVQLAKLHGCRVITTAGRPESIAFCRDVLRADEVIDYRAHERRRARESDMTDGKGLPVVFDTVGGDVFLQSIDCAAVNGQVVTILGANTGRSRPVPALPERHAPLRVHGHSNGVRDRARTTGRRSSPASRGSSTPVYCIPT